MFSPDHPSEHFADEVSVEINSGVSKTELVINYLIIRICWPNRWVIAPVEHVMFIHVSFYWE